MPRRIAYFQVAPEGIKALQGVDAYFKSSNIEPRLRALVELRASQINGCAYCLDMHSKDARASGETEQNSPAAKRNSGSTASTRGARRRTTRRASAPRWSGPKR